MIGSEGAKGKGHRAWSKRDETRKAKGSKLKAERKKLKRAY